MTAAVDHLLREPVSARELAKRLELEYGGPDILIAGVIPLDKLKAMFLAWRGPSGSKPLHAPSDSVVISLRSPRLVDDIHKTDARVGWISTSRPRFAFARALRILDELGFGFLPKTNKQTGTYPALRSDIALGDGNIFVGRGSVIGANVKIERDTAIGTDCIIGSGTIIGESGFAYERDSTGVPFELRQLGGVTIGDCVDIGANVTIACGGMDDTVIGDHTKIDDRVHIAHSCRIGSRVIIAAGAIICGSVTIEDDVYIAPGAVIRDHVTVGKKSFIGLGAVLVTDAAADRTYVGSPAKPIETR